MASKLPSSRGKARTIEDALSRLSDEKLTGDFDDIFKLMPVTKETSCGGGWLSSPLMQKCANKKVLVLSYGIISLVFSGAGAYFNGTITTVEKRFKIPSQNIGIISVGNDISALFLSPFIAYYGGKSHRPRWIGVGMIAFVFYCLMTAVPHFIFGSGEEALSLTAEYGGVRGHSDEKEDIANRKLLCRQNATEGVAECEIDGGNLMPQVFLFLAQIIAGIGHTLCGTLGISYMDDNIKKSKTPALMSFSFFMRLLGPALGYTLASLCLKFYISPDLTPIINNKDVRWLGAWWLGWLFFALVLFICSIVTMMFPRELPRAAVRRRIEKEKIKRGLKESNTVVEFTEPEEVKASVSDMIVTYKRLFKNKVYMLMHVSGILHLFGFLPYWIYTPKLIETIYHQSASSSSFYTGTLAIVFSGIGVLVGGLFISRYKPSARFLTLWHIFCGCCCVAGMVSYAFMGCEESDKTLNIRHDATSTCNSDCHCDFVKYSPVCGDDGFTYTSACHAGCTDYVKTNVSKSFGECSCINDIDQGRLSTFSWGVHDGPQRSAKPGQCAVNCQTELFFFLAVMCFLKFIGATGRTSHFLVSIRCIDEKDKTVAIGMAATLVHLFAFIPSPILFGYILDKTCLVWSGKTCGGTGNCWLYDAESLRYLLNFTAAFFVALGTIGDVFVWYFVKDLKIFDDDDEAESKSKNTKDEVSTRY